MTACTLATVWSFVYERWLPEAWKEKVGFLDIVLDLPWYIWLIVGLVVVLVIALEWAYRQEEQRRPTLEIVVDKSEQRYQDRIEVAAILRITNLGQEWIRNCCVRVVDLQYKMRATVNGERKEWWYPKFENQDIYLRWRGASESGTQHWSFQSRAIVEVAVSPSWGGTQYMLGDTKWRPEIQLGISDDHLLTVEVSAENVPPQIRTYELRIDSPGVLARMDVPSRFKANEVHFQEVSD